MNDALVEKLLSTYRRTFREEHYGGMWKKIFDRHQRPLHDVFMTGTPEDAEAILRNPASNYLHYGFENTFAGCDGGQNTSDVTLLRKLGEALGTERFEYPEATSPSMKARKLLREMDSAGAVVRKLCGAQRSAEDILVRIDRMLGPIDFPNPFPGETGVVTTRGVASFRAVNAIYQASLLKGRVLEIGGGLGRTAYYASRFGVTDYTIVDLPFTGISQGYFLGRTLGEHGVKLLSPDEFFASTDTYDVALNVDSLTELPVGVAEKYAKAVKARASQFISVNHEAGAFTVRDVFGRPHARHEYALRPGYAEETFITA